MPATEADVRALHRYLIWSLNMRDHFHNTVEEQGEPPGSGNPNKWLIKPFMYVSLRFALLYAVVEGYRELQLSDSAVELLLQSQHIDLLRRFRNGAFHYQRDYFDPRFRNFLTEPAIKWAEELESALSSYFLRWYESKGLRVVIVEDGKA